MEVREGLTGKVQMSFGVLANDRFFMMASNIVPFDSVTIEIVQNSQTSFIFSSLMDLFTVIRLTLADTRGEVGKV